MDKSGFNPGLFGIDHGYEFIEWELHALSIFVTLDGLKQGTVKNYCLAR